MKTTNSRKLVMTLGGILIATVAAGCYGGGGGPGYYSSQPYGYNSSYSSYGSSYPYSGYSNGQHYQQNNVSSYHGGYQNAARADENRDQHVAAAPNRGVTRTETQHANVDHDKVSLKDSEPSRTVRN
jgi:hypothetical protein